MLPSRFRLSQARLMLKERVELSYNLKKSHQRISLDHAKMMLVKRSLPYADQELERSCSRSRLISLKPLPLKIGSTRE